MRRFAKAIIVCLFITSFVDAQTQRNPQVTAQELQAHVRYLASDELEGRRSGTKGGDKAAEYLVSEFKSYGLLPKGDLGSFLQKFEFVAGVELGPKNTLMIRHERKEEDLKLNEEFRPLGFSLSGSFSGGVVFGGYGISAPDKNYDDYKDIDIKDKAVILFRYSPAADSSRNEFEQYSSLRYKASKAKELGAKAILVVTGAADSDTDDLIKLSYDQSMGNAGILAFSITRKAADRMLETARLKLKDVQVSIMKSRTPKSLTLQKVTVDLSSDVQEIRQITANVIGYLEGSDPVLKNDVIVVGAHYDHLGFGGEGSGSTKPDTVAIHYGADDNASGTSGLLELAQSFSVRKNELKRSIVFISFAGEELGVLGSAYYVKNPTVPLEHTIAMINMDMIGRLHNKTLIVYGVGTSAEFEPMMKKHNVDSTFTLKLVKDGFGPSDQASFYGKKIPVFHFFTDIHSDYHRPSDTWDRLNYPGMEQVVIFVESIALELDQTDAKPKYVAVETPKMPAGGGRNARVYMGTVPDFGEQVEGMKLSAVREGSPAAKAGLLAGDIIVKFGKLDVKNLYDFTYALGEYKPGDEVDVVAKRGKDTITLKVKLEKRN